MFQDPNDLPDWSKSFNLTNDFIPVNGLIFLGANTVNSGSPAPSSMTVPITTANALQTQFDTFYVFVTFTNSILEGIKTTSSLEFLLYGVMTQTFGPDVINGVVIFSGGPVNDLEPLLFNSVSLTIASSQFAPNTNYTFNLFGIRNVRPGLSVQNQTSITETDGTITTAGTWQKVAALQVPSKLTVFQNQGTGNMQIAFSGSSAPTATGLLLLPKGSLTNADVTQAVQSPSGLNLWVKGTNAGDPFVLWSG